MIQKNYFKISRLHEKCLIIQQHKFYVEIHEINFSEYKFFDDPTNLFTHHFKVEQGDFICPTFLPMLDLYDHCNKISLPIGVDGL